MASTIDVEELFAVFDSDGDGCISLHELESLVGTVLEKSKRT